MRVVSLVPSTTHTVAALGAAELLVGCTTFCIDPPGLARKIKIIGGTKDPDLEAISSLRPDLILCNTEENRREDIANCRAIAPVLEAFPRSPLEVPEMIEELGMHIARPAEGAAMANRIRVRLEQLQEVAALQKMGRSFIYLIWRSPWMCAGKDTYISSFLELAGLRNVITAPMYPVIETPAKLNTEPDMVLFSTEPWPFRRRDVDAWQADGGFGKSLFKIDGKALSWHGAETEKAATSLRLWIEGNADPGFVRPF